MWPCACPCRLAETDAKLEERQLQVEQGHLQIQQEIGQLRELIETSSEAWNGAVTAVPCKPCKPCKQKGRRGILYGQAARGTMPTLHIICERDVGLFSLIQQVIANIPWAFQERRVPVAYFRERTCYWTPKEYRDRDTVWEYYFEPIVPEHPASSVSPQIRGVISLHYPSPFEVGYFAHEHAFVSNHFGDHPDLSGKTLFIPYLLDDPDEDLRRQASTIIDKFVRPRGYVQEKVERFYRDQMKGRRVIGVHVRGTDAVSAQEIRWHRQGSLRLPRYREEIERLLQGEREAMIFAATDAQSSVDYLKDAFESRVIAYDSIRHQGGEAAGKGPTGWIMPDYIAGDRDRAARNGEEAVIEYLLLARCDHLVHNGSSLARTVLLKVPEMPHTNTHGGHPGGESDSR